MPDSLNASRRQGRILAFAAFLITTFALLLVAGRAYADVPVSNSGSITINDATTNGTPKASTPDPSNITVANLTGPVTKVTATVNGFAHGCPTDTGMLLVGPQGQESVLMSYIGDCTHNQPGPARPDITLTFDDNAAAGNVPCLVTSSNGTPVSTTNMSGGTFKPTNGPPLGQTGSCAFAEGSTPINFNVGSPIGPVGPYPTGLSVFNGLDPNGTWRLYTVDEWKGDGGHISHGWSLNFTITPPTVTAPGISGTAQVGQLLTAASGTITNAGSAATWQWNRCDGSGQLCQPIAGANGDTYAPTSADVGHTLTVTESVTNSGGNDSKSSGPTAIVAAAPVVTPPVTPPVTPSKTPAHISTSGLKTKQKVLSQHGILATLTTSITGKLVATATVSVPKLAKVYRFKTVRATVVAGNRTTVLLRLSKSGLKAIKKALGKHKRLNAKLTLVVTTASGAKTTVHKTIRIVR